MKTDTIQTRSQRIDEQLDKWKQLAEQHQAVLVGFSLDSEDNFESVIDSPPEFVLEGFALPASLLQSNRPHGEPGGGLYKGKWVAHPDWAATTERVREFGRAARRAEVKARMTRHADERAFWAGLWDIFVSAVGSVVSAVIEKHVLEQPDDHQNKAQLDRCKKVESTPVFDNAVRLGKTLTQQGFTDVDIKIRMTKTNPTIVGKAKLGNAPVKWSVEVDCDWEFVETIPR